jgi:hypothetical protein
MPLGARNFLDPFSTLSPNQPKTGSEQLQSLRDCSVPLLMRARIKAAKGHGGQIILLAGSQVVFMPGIMVVFAQAGIPQGIVFYG